jgi:hypothetical protein
MTILVVDPHQGSVQQRQLSRSGTEDASGCLALTVRQGQLGGALIERVTHLVVMREAVQVRTL